jgi:hypothetical protein
MQQTDDELAAEAPEAAAAREMWSLFEPLHVLTYFAPESVAALKEVGLRGYWMSYFAGRAAPMGAVSAAVVESTFYNFSPVLVRRAIPDAWTFASPDAVVAARTRGVAAALDALGDAVPADRAAEALALLRPGLAALDLDGRALAAANAALELADDPRVALWQAATTLREHRGDGHVATLLHAGIGGLEAHVLLVGTGRLSRATVQPARAWTDDEWAQAEERLRSRGLLDGDARCTGAGRDLRRRIEADTDRLAAAPWRALGPETTDRLAALVEPIAVAIADSGVLPASIPSGFTLSRSRPGTPSAS